MENESQIQTSVNLITDLLRANNVPPEVAFSSLMNILIGIALASGIPEENFNSCLTQARKHFKKMKRAQEKNPIS